MANMLGGRQCNLCMVKKRLSEQRIRNVQAGLGRVGAVFHFESVSKVERVLAIINAGTLMCLKP